MPPIGGGGKAPPDVCPAPPLGGDLLQRLPLLRERLRVRYRLGERERDLLRSLLRDRSFLPPLSLLRLLRRSFSLSLLRLLLRLRVPLSLERDLRRSDPDKDFTRSLLGERLRSRDLERDLGLLRLLDLPLLSVTAASSGATLSAAVAGATPASSSATPAGLLSSDLLTGASSGPAVLVSAILIRMHAIKQTASRAVSNKPRKRVRGRREGSKGGKGQREGRDRAGREGEGEGRVLSNVACGWVCQIATGEQVLSRCRP